MRSLMLASALLLTSLSARAEYVPSNPPLKPMGHPDNDSMSQVISQNFELLLLMTRQTQALGAINDRLTTIQSQVGSLQTAAQKECSK